jgi:outer membrane protein TolC
MKNQYKIFLPLFFVMLLSQSLFAQRILTLEEAIATALHNNYEIQLSRNDSRIAAIDYSYRNAVFLPTVNANAGITKTNNRQKQILADDSEKSGRVKNQVLQGNVSLSWVLFDGLKMFATREKSAAILQAGTYAAKDQIVNTIANVINVYYDIARQQQLIKATDVQIKLDEERTKLAQYKLDNGSGAKPDVLQSKVDLNEQRALKMAQETLFDQLKEQLVQAMNSNIKAQEFEILDTIPVNYHLSFGDLQDGIDLSNPSLLLAKSGIDIAAYTLKESRAERFPVVSFNSAYSFNRNSNQIVLNPYSTKLNQAYGYNFGFGAQIPIFNQFNVRKQIQQNKLALSFQKLNYDNQRSLVLLNLVNSFKTYEQQKKQLKLEEENILLAQENVSIVFETYRLGMATLIQLRQAQLSLAQAYDRLIQARYNTKLAETELMRLKGDIVK